MKIKLHVRPSDGLDIPSSIPVSGTEIQVEDFKDGWVTLTMNEDLSLKAHIKALQEIVGPDCLVSQTPPVEHKIDFKSDLSYTHIPVGKLVWDSVFRKPEPVLDVLKWGQSPLSDDYVYLPNNNRKTGADAEEYVANAHYTEVLVNAYRAVCEKYNIDPVVFLSNGKTLRCRQTLPYHGTDHTSVGGRSARLANSRLIDFDDSYYAKAFIQAIIDLKPGQYENEAIKRRVLAKVEKILMGKTSHVHNQRFIQRFLEHLVKDQDTTEAVLAVLKCMVVEGYVLEDSLQEFEIRLVRSRLTSDLPYLTEVFKSCSQGGVDGQ